MGNSVSAEKPAASASASMPQRPQGRVFRKTPLTKDEKRILYMVMVHRGGMVG
nr:hypothetical protein TetV2_00274 [Oceanusvirus sp.]